MKDELYASKTFKNTQIISKLYDQICQGMFEKVIIDEAVSPYRLDNM